MKIYLINILLFPLLTLAQTEKGTIKVRKQATNEVFTIVEEMPTFPGGQNAMFQFMRENLIYPDSAKFNNITGTVYVNFIIETDGSLNDIKVIRGIHRLLDDEAIRVVKLMPKWTPGVQRGKSVAVSFNIPINFRLR